LFKKTCLDATGSGNLLQPKRAQNWVSPSPHTFIDETNAISLTASLKFFSFDHPYQKKGG